MKTRKIFVESVIMMLLMPFLQILNAQDTILENPRLNPQLMKRGINGVIQRAALNLDHPSTSQVPKDWIHWIDSAWGEGLPISQKLNIFDEFWNTVDQRYGGFVNLNVNWDSLRDHYRPIVAAGVSEGRFYGIMTNMANELMELHTWVRNTSIDSSFLTNTVSIWPTHRVPLVAFGGWGVTQSGAGVTPLSDSSLLVYRTQISNPLGIQAGDIILGYDGRKWKDILHAFDSVKVPSTMSFIGSSNDAYIYSRLNAASMNWWMFDTMDIVKYSTGDTVHLATQLLADATSLWDSLMCMDNIPVAGVPEPDVFNGEWCTWGIIEGTNIGYIYLWSLNYSNIATDFAQAVKGLMNTTTGLIIDIRGNWGGSAALCNEGFSYLFNENMDLNYDFVIRSSPTDHFSFTHHPSSLGFVPTPGIYDHPIAVLTGPGCFSSGELTAYRLKFHPMVRFFGKQTNTAYPGTYLSGTLVNDTWTYRMPTGSVYSISDGFGYLIHKGFNVDEEIWHNRDDAANGVDAVVERAIEWISNAVHAHDISINKSSFNQVNDTVHLYGMLENPSSHPFTLRAYYQLDGIIVDSSEFSENEGIWETAWLPSQNGGTYDVAVVTRDLAENQTFKLPHIAHFTVAGISLSSISLDFGTLAEDSTRTDSIQIRNPYSSVLNITSAVSNVPQQFSVLPVYNIIPAGDSTTFYITYHPTTFGTHYGHIEFTHDKEYSPAILELTGKCNPPSVQFAVETDWNMISLPMQPFSYVKDSIFTNSITPAYTYINGYNQKDTLSNGVGYWLKYSAPQMVEVPGTVVLSDSFDVQIGWNMIGSITYPVAVTSIGSDPPSMETSDFYNYTAAYGYSVADSIKPGYGYWVKASEEGRLILSLLGNMPMSSRIKIIAGPELPPAPPKDEKEIVMSKEIPTEYSLAQNYPNPFNPNTSIFYGIPERSRVVIEIYNVLGQIITTLTNEEQEPGYRSVEWSAVNGIGSGIYFYRLTAASVTEPRRMFVQVRKMLMIK